MANTQLRLVADPQIQPASRDATRMIFEHWLFMSGRSPRRCKLGPTRRPVIDAALAIGYDVETLMLAIEGMAADPLTDASHDRMRDAMREIEWLLAREARIERWAALGEQLRADVEAKPTTPDAAPVVIDQAVEAAHRERLRQRAAAMRGAVHG